MERASRLFDFPPEASDLDKPVSLIRDAQKTVLRALKAVQDLEAYTAKFPTVATEREKRQALMAFRDVLSDYKRVADQVGRLSADTAEIGELLTRAFHEPKIGEPAMEIMASRSVKDPAWKAS